MAAISSKASAVAGEERLEPEGRLVEALELAIRTREGVEAGSLPEDEALLGLVARERGRAVLTRRGRLLANEVACRLRPAVPTA
jgi:coproporphyrinogen III oxidase-like Fe-S oxidoreductase